jgi:hypothetical protein
MEHFGKNIDKSKIILEFKEKKKIFDPKKIYSNESSPTKL